MRGEKGFFPENQTSVFCLVICVGLEFNFKNRFLQYALFFKNRKSDFKKSDRINQKPHCSNKNFIRFEAGCGSDPEGSGQSFWD